MGLVDLIELDIDTPANLPNIGIYKFGLHLIQILFAFLTFCILIPIISIERHYNGSSQLAPNYTLVVTLTSMFVSIALALFPWSKYRNHLVTVRNFFLRPRTAVIFNCFLTLAWFAAMVSMSVHSNNESNCTLNAKLQKSDTGYSSAWIKQCNSAKAAAAFSWLSFFVWLASAVCSIILLWHEKKVRHAEADAVATAARNADASSNCEEDARTIVDMDYTDKDKQLEDRYNTRSSIDSEEESRPTSPSPEAHPLPMTPSALPMNSNSFTSPYIPNDLVINTAIRSSYDAPRPTPSFIPSPSNLASPYNPHINNIPSVGSPYSIPASVASPYHPQTPVIYTSNSYQQPQSSTQTSFASYSNIPLEQYQQYKPTGVYQNVPLAYTNIQPNYPSTPSHQHQDYPAYGHN